MTNKRISDLPSATSVDQTDEVEILQGGISKRSTINKITSIVTGPPGPAGASGAALALAAPTVTVGLAVKNGGGTGKSMPNDGAPALDVSIAPTWTGAHTFAVPIVVQNQNFTFAKIQNVSTSRVLGRTTAGAGDIEQLTVSAPLTLAAGALGLDLAANITWTGTHTFNNTPVVPNSSWTYAKIQNVSATARILGRVTAGAGVIEEMTGTQATSLLNVFTSTLNGLAPLSGGGTTNFLRADGTWAAPPGGGGGTPGGSDTQIQFNDASSFGGDSGFTFTKATKTVTLGTTATAGILKGPDNGAGAGVNLTFKGGDSTSGIVGSIFITGGTRTGVTTNVNSGKITITGGVGGTTSGPGAAASLNGGSALVNGAGGAVSLSGGAGNGAFNGGGVTLQTGMAGATGNSGAMSLSTNGGGATSGNSGAMTLDTGTVVSGTVGDVNLNTGGVNRLLVRGDGVGITATVPIKLAASVVASLPSAVTAGAGSTAFATDATATTFASIVAGGGANNVPLYSDGTNWRIG